MDWAANALSVKGSTLFVMHQNESKAKQEVAGDYVMSCYVISHSFNIIFLFSRALLLK